MYRTKVLKQQYTIRTTIPKMVVEALSLEDGQSISWTVKDGKVIIEKYNKDGVK